MKKTVKIVLIVAVILAASVVLALKFQISHQTPTPEKSINILPPPVFVSNPDAVPDALIVTRSLSQLPKDVLKQPLLKDILTEDFLFYYEESESFLNLKGTLKRLAFEHDLSILDEIFAYVLNEPAEIAFWKSFNGRLDEYMMVLKRNGLTDFLTAVAKIAVDDNQLSKYGERDIPGYGKTSVYMVRYSNNRNLYFTGLKDNLIIFSHPEMKLPTDEVMKKWTDSAKARFGKSENESFFSKLFEPENNSAKHSIYLSLSYLSFGYQSFFPSIDAIKFTFADNEWKTWMLTRDGVDQKSMNSEALWKVLPKAPALCASLPVSKGNVGELFNKLFPGKPAIVKESLMQINTPVGLCWYPESKIYTPLFVANVTGPIISRDILKDLFEESTGTFEAGILSEDEMRLFKEQQRQIAEGNTVDDPIRASKFYQPFPVEEDINENGVIWSREVSSRYGIHNSERSKHNKNMRSIKYFNVKLAFWRGYLIFSLDDRLVDNVMAVLDKKYPALSDSISQETKNIALFLSPGHTADLLRSSVLDSLPAEQESVFRESVSRRLFPALDKMKMISPLSLNWPTVMEGKEQRWEELKWRAISSN